MSVNFRVFVSCVTGEFVSLRKQIKEWLINQWPEIEVKTQEDFDSDGGTMLQLIDGYVRQCHVVIHLVGMSAGSVPESPDRDAIWERYASELAPSLAFLSDQPTRESASFTQWESYLAVQHCRFLLIARSREASQFETSQQKHWENTQHWSNLEKTGRVRTIDFQDFMDLSGRLQRPVQKEVQRFAGFATARFLSEGNQFAELQDRCSQLELLADAFRVAEAAERPVVAMLHGPPGVGKTALVQSWIDALDGDGGLEKHFEQAFACTMPGQGGPRAVGEIAHNPNQVTPQSLQFLSEGIRHFADLRMASDAADSPNLRGDTLARDFRSFGGLMVLDGVESFQRPPSRVTQPYFHDKELNDFVAQLLEPQTEPISAPCLLVLTSYWALPYQKDDWFRCIHLDNLSEAGAVSVLTGFEIPETQYRLTPVVPEGMTAGDVYRLAAASVDCNPLGLNLLASYLIACQGGRLRVVQRGDTYEIESLEQGLDLDHVQPPHTRRDRVHLAQVVLAWIDFLQAHATAAQTVFERGLAAAMLALLRAFSVFGRPVAREDLRRFEDTDPTVSELLWEPIKHEATRKKAIATLKHYHFLTEHQNRTLSFSHHFVGDQVAEEFSEGELHQEWEAAHAALFDSYNVAGSPEDISADKVLRLATACARGARSLPKRQEALKICLEEVRVSERADQLPTWSLLAAKSDDLALLSNFYVDPWRVLRDGIAADDRGELFNETGYVLQKLARFGESMEAFEQAAAIWDQLCRGATPENRGVYLGKAIRDRVLLAKSLSMAMEFERLTQTSEELGNLKDELVTLREDRNEELSPGDLLRCIDACALRAWAAFLSNDTDTAVELFEDYCKYMERRAAIDASERGVELVRTQKMLTYTRFLIETGQFNEAHGIIDIADDICQRHTEQNGRNGELALQGDIAFNVLLRGMAFSRQCQLNTGTAAKTLCPQAVSVLTDAEQRFWQLDLLDGWLQCQLELANLHASWARCDPHALEASLKHFGRVAQFMLHTDVPLISLELSCANARISRVRCRAKRDHKQMSAAVMELDAAFDKATEVGFAWKANEIEEELTRWKQENGERT